MCITRVIIEEAEKHIALIELELLCGFYFIGQQPIAIASCLLLLIESIQCGQDSKWLHSTKSLFGRKCASCAG